MFTDIHYGAKNNSPVHNEDCDQFVDWMIKIGRDHDCETCIFLGDYHNNRANMNLKTMHYAVRGLDTISKNFEHTYFILGNHDLFYKDKRDVHSTPWGTYIPKVTIIHEPTVIKNVLLCPWLVENEWKALKRKQGEYVFGHFELPNFYMNAMIKMPDYGEIQLDTFKHFHKGFTGHFHKRQHQNNMYYIGNAFPHNYADAGDEDRGVAILEWGEEPYYIAWPDQPTYQVTTLSNLIDNANVLLKDKQHLRVLLDIDISFEEANFIKETFMKQCNIRELTLIAEKTQYENGNTPEISVFESIDQIVLEGLMSVSSESFDKNKLIEIYNQL